MSHAGLPKDTTPGRPPCAAKSRLTPSGSFRQRSACSTISEWQSLYLLVLLSLKTSYRKSSTACKTPTPAPLAQDEEAMLDARYTRRSQLRGKLTP